MRAKLGPVLMVLTLAGCASDKFNNAVAGYRDGRVEALIARWGEPEHVSVTPRSRAHVYTWSSAGRDSASAPSCTVKVLADRLDRITAFGFHGDDDACAAFADRLHDPN